MLADLLQKGLIAEFELCVAPDLGIAAVSDHQFSGMLADSIPVAPDNNYRYHKISVQKEAQCSILTQPPAARPNPSKIPILIRLFLRMLYELMILLQKEYESMFYFLLVSS